MNVYTIYPKKIVSLHSKSKTTNACPYVINAVTLEPNDKGSIAATAIRFEPETDPADNSIFAPIAPNTDRNTNDSNAKPVNTHQIAKRTP